MEFALLGPLEARRDGVAVPLGGPRQRAVLAILLTRANRMVPADLLVDELWSSDPPRTATSVLQTYVSNLRKVLGHGVVVTSGAGYVAAVEPASIDLHRFESLLEAGSRALGHGEPAEASRLLAEALSVWRGPALADFAYEPFAQAEIARLEELRLLAVERRLEADLRCGLHAELVAELEALVALHPHREQLYARLMVALYRSGRQAEALAAYRSARQTLTTELGIEPGQPLRELEQAILRQDASLLEAQGETQPVPTAARAAVLVALDDTLGIDGELVALGASLAGSSPPRDLIAVRVVEPASLGVASRDLFALCETLAARGVTARGAALTPRSPGEDVVRLAGDQDADLVLLPAPRGLLEDGRLEGETATILASATCDVAILARGAGTRAASPGPVVVPFGGADDDWAAVEIAAWIVRAADTSLRLLGSHAGLVDGERDASRLLASASLLIQRFVRVPTDPVLAPAGAESVVAAAADASLVVVGLSPRWRTEGLGDVRLEIALRSPVPVLLVRKGLRPGGIAPPATMTRFTWSIVGR